MPRRPSGSSSTARSTTSRSCAPSSSSAGTRFRTRSDTEVIVHGYKEWGTQVFGRLNGMFGLAIWDVRRQRLVVARDAMGIKLVYYKTRRRAADVRFGDPCRARRRAAVAGRRSGGAEPVPQVPLHAVAADDLQGRPQARAGHDAGRRERASAAKSVGTTTRPCRFPTSKSDRRSDEELLHLYKGAVKRHLLSDVPVGILLSGGLDSGLLLALMKEHGQRLAGLHRRLRQRPSKTTN